MQLVELAQTYRSLAVVGMAKNVGKTVTLNYLIRELNMRGLTVGITSIGYDGEERDALTNLPKPKVNIPAKGLVATADSVFKLGSAELELVERTGEYTFLGEVIIGRARTAGNVHLAGPARIRPMKRVQDRLNALGADICLVDGALDRIATAAPHVTEATVLATGAALNSVRDIVLNRTAERVRHMQLEPVEPELTRNLRNALTHAGAAVLLEDGSIEPLTLISALGSAEQLSKLITSRTKALILRGAVVDSTFHALSERLQVSPGLTLAVRDGTCIFSEGAGWKKFLSLGGRVRVLNPIRLLAVTVNPTSPTGPSFQAQPFLEDMSRLLSPLPVFDLVLAQTKFMP